jgi:ribosomal protein S12 methylthiotransferase accessory factor
LTVQLQAVMPSTARETLPILKTFVSPYTGIVQAVAEFLRTPDEPNLITYAASLSQGEPVIGPMRGSHTGGTHWDRDSALAAALGEAIERYSASYIPQGELVTTSASRLNGKAPAPDRFALFHPRQYEVEDFPFVPFTDETVISWVRGFSLTTGEEAYLPARLVFMGSNLASSPEALIGYPTSNGVACGASAEEAILRGLLEIVERDAFVIAWYNRLSLPLLDCLGDAALEAIDARFATAGLSYAAVDLSGFFGIPVVLGVAHGAPGELGALGVGAGSAATVQEAYRKALAEAFSVHTHTRDAVYENPDAIPGSPSEINTFDDHIFFYATEKRAALASFLDSSPERRPTAEVPPLPGSNLKEQIEAATELVARRGVSVYAVDVTSPDVRPSGLVVMRVISPELCPLDVVDRARYLGGTRLYRAAVEAGLAPKPLEYDDLNRYPHPFP